MSAVVFGVIWIAIGFHGFTTALNRLLHPEDFRRPWRWITWGNVSLSYRVRTPVQSALQIEVAFWGCVLAAGVVYLLVEAIK